jgi:phage-related protein
MPIPAEIIAEKNKISNDSPWLVLLDIALSEAVTLRLSSGNAEVSFQGETYYPYEMQIQFTPQSIEGSIPEITIGVDNSDRVVQGYIEALSGAVDCEVTMYLVHQDNLTSDFSDLERHFKILATVCNNDWVVFTLGLQSPTYLRFPLYRTMGNHCNWIFRGIECSYTGGTTECDHTLKNCQALGNSTRFGGFPGLNLSGTKFL